jgi:hypothetical protein
MFLASLISELNWRPGFGDPDFVGWAITAAYAVAALLSGLCARSAGGNPASRDSRRARVIWGCLALLMALLGANKQLDLQTLVVDFGRAVSQRGGWYEARQPVKIAFDALLALAGLLFLFVAGRGILRHLRLGRKMILAGLALILAYVVIRALPGHSSDSAPHAPFWPVEFAGVALVATSAARERFCGTRRGGGRFPANAGHN